MSHRHVINTVNKVNPFSFKEMTFCILLLVPLLFISCAPPHPTEIASIPSRGGVIDRGGQSDGASTMPPVFQGPRILQTGSDGTTIDLNDSNNATYGFARWSFNSGTNTYSVTGDVTIEGNLFRVSRTLTLNISPGATVQWDAQTYVGVSTFSGPLITLPGDGTFMIMQHTWLQHEGSGNTINATGNTSIIVEGSVLAATGSVITSDGLSATVTVQRFGAVFSEAKTNLRPAINMANNFNVGDNVFVKDNGCVWTILDDAAYGYAIQTYGNIIIDGGDVYSAAINGRAINLVGVNSKVIMNGGNVHADGTNGVAISTATTAGIDVSNASVYIYGGTVSADGTSGNSHAIRTTGANAVVEVTGGTVSATSGGNAIYTASGNTDTVIVNGGVVSATTGNAIHTTGVNSAVTVSGNSKVSSMTGRAIQSSGKGLSSVTVNDTSQVWVMTNGNAIRSSGTVIVNGGFIFAYGERKQNPTYTWIWYVDAGSVINAANTFSIAPGTPALVVAWNAAAGNRVYPEGSRSTDHDFGNSYIGTVMDFEWHNHPVLGGGINYRLGSSVPGFFPVAGVTVAHDFGLIFDASTGDLFYGEGARTQAPGKGLTWDATGSTLTLKGFSWSTVKEAALTVINGTATINLAAGTVNTFVSAGPTGNSFGIYSDSALVINGGGTLVAVGSGTAAGYSNGLNTNGLTINSGTVEARGGTSALNKAPASLPFAYTYWTNTANVDPGGQGAAYTIGAPFPHNVPYLYNANDKYVKITSGPLAVVADATVSGTAGTMLAPPQSATITLYDDMIAAGMTAEYANTWFANLPSGLRVRATAAAGSDTVYLEFEGLPAEASNQPFRITVPAGVLAGNAAITVLFNADAKFDIYPAPIPPPPDITWPVASTITYGDTLFDSALTGGSGDGSFAWADDTIVPPVQNLGYEVIFTHTNGEIVTHIVEITVNRRRITVAAIDETIVYGSVPVLAYEITHGDLVNGDVLSGGLRVDNFEVGTHAIKRGMLSTGSNYAITFIEGTLTILGDYLSTDISVSVNNRIPMRDNNDFFTDAICGENRVAISVTSTNRNLTIIINGLEQNPRTVDLQKYGDNYFTIIVRGPNNYEQSYTLRINRLIPFEQLVVMRWDNTLSIINNRANNGGFNLTSFRWLRNGQQFSTAQWWSAGANGELLDTIHEYQAGATTDTGDTLLTCPTRITLRGME